MSAENIISDWKKKIYKPVYWLEGEEPYYIDKIIHYAEHHILSESEASFNLTVFYGKDAQWADILNACKRYPMFSELQVVILKEAQLMKDYLMLENYITNPLQSTVFIVGYKESKIDGKTKFGKLLKDKALVLTTKKLYENELPSWISTMVINKGLKINPKAVDLLVDHIGNDLNRLENEIDKVVINLAGSTIIDEDAIEKFVGISKEFNVYELQKAIAKKDLAKCLRIINYFKSNPKAAPLQLLLPSIYSFFSRVLAIVESKDKSNNALKPLFNNNYYAAEEGLEAYRNFGQQGLEKVILLLHEYNLKSIGINDKGTENSDLLKEMLVKMVC